MSVTWRRVLLLHLLTQCAAPLQTRHRVVATAQGAVRGYYARRPPHYAYRGVPYARAPTTRNRFKAPEPARAWSGIFEAIHRIKCPQPDGSGEENCLVVNVFAPEHAASQPVIVHFHPGGFQQGWGLHSGARRLLEQGFVFVTFNYRLGVLGFLCLGVPGASGNAGLKDQVAALYWVNRNIDKFGGNPLDVTAYGTGSGAASIQLLLFSGLTDNLLHKVILESGSALSPSAISYEPVVNAFNFAKDLGYTHDSKPDMLLDFFYKIPYDDIVNTSENFRPCIEPESTESLLDKDPRDYLRNGKYQNVPMITIYTNSEEVSVIADNLDRFKVIPDSFEYLLPNNLIFSDEDTRIKVTGVVKEFYFEELGLTESVLKSYVAYVNDIFMEYPVIKSAAYHAKNQNAVYLMQFLYKGRKSDNKLNDIPGAGFGDVLKYVVGNDQLEDYDEIIVERLITMWTNYIKLGDPTPLTSLLIPEVWQPVQPHIVDGKVVLRNIPCLRFGQSMTTNLLSGQQLVFWDRIYDMFYINSSDQPE